MSVCLFLQLLRHRFMEAGNYIKMKEVCAVVCLCLSLSMSFCLCVCLSVSVCLTVSPAAAALLYGGPQLLQNEREFVQWSVSVSVFLSDCFSLFLSFSLSPHFFLSLSFFLSVFSSLFYLPSPPPFSLCVSVPVFLFLSLSLSLSVSLSLSLFLSLFPSPPSSHLTSP